MAELSLIESDGLEADALRILVFEDSAMDAALIKKFLRTAGILGNHIYHADTITSALQVMARTPIDLCLADYHLNPFTGVDLMEEARRSNLDIPFIVLTAIDDRSVDEEVLAHGAYDFLVKGDLTVEGLDRSIRYAMASHRREQKLVRAAYFDALTNLPNRLSFLERLTQAVSDNCASGGLVGIALFNLDGTKLINTRFGHEVGDEMLRIAAKRLTPFKKEGDFLARIGGDEFALLMNGVLLTGHALNATRAAANAVTAPMETDQGKLMITATWGVAAREIKNCDNARDVAQELLLSATHAMFEAKISGRRRNPSNVALARSH